MVTWIIVAHLPSLGGELDYRYLLASGIITTYTWLTAYEFWRGRSEPLVSRWPAILMLFAHGSLFLLRTPLFAMVPWAPTDQVFESVWLTVLSFEALLFTIAIAFILLAMANERTEYRHKTAAMVDPLTGIANRRAFLQDGNELMKRDASNPCPAAVLLDLDHFKSINDRFGHAIGDRVLHRPRGQSGPAARRAGAARAGRSGALFRQGARQEPGRGGRARSRAASHRADGTVRRRGREQERRLSGASFCACRIFGRKTGSHFS